MIAKLAVVTLVALFVVPTYQEAEADDVPNPATVSSYAGDQHTEKHATDGDPATFWRAANDDPQPTLQLDLGAKRSISSIRQTFATSGIWHFHIDGSVDAKKWTTLVDHRNGAAGTAFAQSLTGNYHYLRLTVTRAPKNDVASSREFTATTENNLAIGADVTTSSHLTDYEGASAVDGDSSTHWAAADGSYPQSMTVDLGASHALSRVEQHFKDFDTFGFRISASADGEQWDEIVDRRSGATGQQFAYDVSGTYRYLRLELTSSASNRWAGSTELKVYGAGHSQPPAPGKWWDTTSGVMRFYAKYYGITLDQITASLDKLKAQGYGAVEVFAPYVGPAIEENFAGLGGTDLYNIDPSIGTLKDFDELIAAAHARDMKVLMFGNLGYAHVSAPFFKQAERDFAAGNDSGWFDFRKQRPDGPDKWYWSKTAKAWYWASWGPEKSGPDDRRSGVVPSFDYASSAWRAEAQRILRFWLDRGIDGWGEDAPLTHHHIDIPRNNEAITDVLREYDVWANPEGIQPYATPPHYDFRNIVRDWHYNSVHDLSITHWGGGGSSKIIDAIRAADPSHLDDNFKDSRDLVAQVGGITQTAPSWELDKPDAETGEPANALPAQWRLLEFATLTSTGTMFYLHNGFHKYMPHLQTIPTWTDQQQQTFHRLLRAQNSYSALGPAGLRLKLPTDQPGTTAFKRLDKPGNVTALVVLNYTDTAKSVTVHLENTGIDTAQRPTDLLTGKPAAPITSDRYTIDLPPYGFAVLGVS